MTAQANAGKVYLVGAGPGDPELLTQKAARLLATAEVVLHDALVSAEVLATINPAAEIDNVGKRARGHHVPQTDINALLVSHASAGKMVVRLKGGDPLVFGRAGEEIEALREAGIEYEIVPGVTSAFAAAAAAGFSLTDRRAASGVLLVSGHACAVNAGVNWAAVAATGVTVVVYMPGDHATISHTLITAGVPADMPCALVSHASLPSQKITRTTVQQLPNAHSEKPNLLVVGHVARNVTDDAARDYTRAASLDLSFLQPAEAAGIFI